MQHKLVFGRLLALGPRTIKAITTQRRYDTNTVPYCALDITMELRPGPECTALHIQSSVRVS